MALPSAYADLAAHTGTLVAVLGTFVFLCLALVGVIYQIMTRIAFTLKDDILKMLKELDSKIEDKTSSIWDAIGLMRIRQENLREELPKEYLRVSGEGYRALIVTMGEIKTHLEEFITDCRTGKCGGKK